MTRKTREPTSLPILPAKPALPALPASTAINRQKRRLPQETAAASFLFPDAKVYII